LLRYPSCSRAFFGVRVRRQAHRGEQDAARAEAERKRVALLTPAAETAAPPALVAPLRPEQERALKPKDGFKECDGCPAMITMPAGSFTMGSPTGEPQRGSDEGPQQQRKSLPSRKRG
jgi:formylglycine-generating enzyme required for sulfatase activity